MIAEDRPACQDHAARLDQLVCETSRRLRRTRVLFDRVSENLAALSGAGEQGAEGGWRRFN